MDSHEISIFFEKVKMHYPKLCKGFSADRIITVKKYWLIMLERVSLRDALEALDEHTKDPEIGKLIPNMIDLERKAKGDGSGRELACTGSINFEMGKP